MAVVGCTVANNSVHGGSQNLAPFGFQSCLDVLVEDCRFAGNYARTSTGDGCYSNGDNKAGPWGGALYCYNAPGFMLMLK